MASKNSKIEVIDPYEHTRVPFLRGILTASLRKAGLSFDEAYTIADKIRGDLMPRAEISTNDLSGLVQAALKKAGHRDVLDRYIEPLPRSFPIEVRNRQGQTHPFSKALLSQTLEICAFPKEKCYAIAADLEQGFINAGITRIDSNKLAEITYQHLLEHESKEASKRYLIWQEFQDSGHPIVLLIGGTVGSGKSTISAELAYRLNIIRTQSTDMLREVMRLMIPSRLLPTLHTSSFNAWQALPFIEDAAGNSETHLEAGFLTQVEQVNVAIEGVLQRALKERLSLIIEGVHSCPPLQDQLVREHNTLIVPVILAVLKPKTLRERLKGRGHEISSRRAKRYLDNFEAIWQLQSFLLAEADRLQIPIITNDDPEQTIQLAMETLSSALAQKYKGDPDTVFL